MLPSDPLQEIFDQTEELAVAIASGCTGALSVLIDQSSREMPELLRQASAVAGAIDMALSTANQRADRSARLTMDRPES